ncbi:uncharacterized protein PHACADRAFT_262703, partial [Phanerochaete carnosa HHB-10118-sp]
MPVPAAPKRAAPPRRKAPKSPSPAPPPPAAEQVFEDAAEVSQSPAPGTPQLTSDDGSKELQEAVRKSKEDEGALGLEPVQKRKSVHEPPKAKEEPVHEEQQPTREVQDNIDELALDNERERGQNEESKQAPNTAHAEEHVEEAQGPAPTDESPLIEERRAVEELEFTGEQPAQAEEEEDEDARRKRIAERLRQQGGFNPFAAPPTPSRKTTVDIPKSPEKDLAFDEVDVEAKDIDAPPPALPEATNIARRESLDLSAPSATSLASPPVPPIATRPVPERKASVPTVPEEQRGYAGESESNYEDEEDDG